jgi:hypothetical protein
LPHDHVGTGIALHVGQEQVSRHDATHLPINQGGGHG